MTRRNLLRRRTTSRSAATRLAQPNSAQNSKWGSEAYDRNFRCDKNVVNECNECTKWSHAMRFIKRQDKKSDENAIAIALRSIFYRAAWYFRHAMPKISRGGACDVQRACSFFFAHPRRDKIAAMIFRSLEMTLAVRTIANVRAIRPNNKKIEKQEKRKKNQQKKK